MRIIGHSNYLVESIISMIIMTLKDRSYTANQPRYITYYQLLLRTLWSYEVTEGRNSAQTGGEGRTGGEDTIPQSQHYETIVSSAEGNNKFSTSHDMSWKTIFSNVILVIHIPCVFIQVYVYILQFFSHISIPKKHGCRIYIIKRNSPKNKSLLE